MPTSLNDINGALKEVYSGEVKWWCWICAFIAGVVFLTIKHIFF